MKKYTKIICMVAAVCLLGTAAFCGFRIYSHYAHESEQEEVFEKIAEVVEQAQTGESETDDVLLTEEETVLAEYGGLYLQNTDMVGWLSIAGTNINYPVMQTPNNLNYYLKHSFEKEYSDLGTPYVQENCDLLTSDNLIIYGHHIKGQKMFGALENYKSKDFYEEHKTVCFDTLIKDKAEQGYYADESSATEYDADRLSCGADRIKDECIHQFNKQGQNLSLSRSDSKAKRQLRPPPVIQKRRSRQPQKVRSKPPRKALRLHRLPLRRLSKQPSIPPKQQRRRQRLRQKWLKELHRRLGCRRDYYCYLSDCLDCRLGVRYFLFG